MDTIWNTLPDMFVSLFQITKVVQAHRGCRLHCMSLLHDEEKRLLHKIDTLTRNINLDYGPHNSHFELSQNCYASEAMGGITYNFAPFTI